MQYNIQITILKKSFKLIYVNMANNKRGTV